MRYFRKEEPPNLFTQRHTVVLLNLDHVMSFGPKVADSTLATVMQSYMQHGQITGFYNAFLSTKVAWAGGVAALIEREVDYRNEFDLRNGITIPKGSLMDKINSLVSWIRVQAQAIFTAA